MKNIVIWIGALVLGAILGVLEIEWLNALFNFIASSFTRLFQFVAVPTIALAVITTLASLGTKNNAGKIFAHTLTYTLLTTVSAAAVGLVLYVVIAPENLPEEVVKMGSVDVPQNLESLSYYDHILNVIPSNVLQPFINGNVLSILIIASSVGLALAFMPQSDN